METLLALATVAVAVAAIVALFLDFAQLRRTPRPKPEPFVPTSLTFIAVPMRRPDDLPGHRR